MRTSLSNLCELFSKNRAVLKSYCKWDNDRFVPICASIFTDRRKEASQERLRQCRSILRKETSAFSTFRSDSELTMISMLAVANLPELQMRRAREVYAILRQHFWGSEYLAVAAMAIAEMLEPDKYEAISAKAKRLYEQMKKNHPLQIGAEDSVIAVMMAFSKLTDAQLMNEAEMCKTLLRKEFGRGTAVHALAYTLTLVEAVAELKCHRVMALYRLLRQKGYRYGTGRELTTLAVLAMLPADIEHIAYDLILVEDFLSRQPGYGIFGYSKTQRMMHAGMVITSDYMGHKENGRIMNSMVISSAIALAAAQQAVLCVAVAAAGAAINRTNKK